MPPRRVRLIRFAAFLLAAVTAAALLAGCSSDRTVLARVDSRTVTAADFAAAARGAQAAYPGDPDSARVHLLQDLAKRTLLLCAADARGTFKDTLAIRYRQLKEEEFLVQALAGQLAPGSIGVSDGEVEQLYAWRDSVTRLQVIYLFTRTAAELAISEVRRGDDFGAVANHYNPAGTIPPNGDLGYQPPGALIDPLDGIARTAAIGSVVGPVQGVGQGWFVLRIAGRRIQKQPPLDMQKPLLAEMLQQRKRRMAAVTHHLRLREAYALETLPGASQALFAHLNSPGGTPPTPTAEDLARPLMRWHEPGGTKTYTFADALADLDVGGREKPNGTVLPAIEEWLLAQGTRHIQVAEARRRGIADDPDFRRMLDENVNGYVLDGLYTDEVMVKAQPQPGDAQAAYAANIARFAKVVGVTLDVMDFPDSASARAFGMQSGQATTLRGAAATVKGAPPVRSVELAFPISDPEWTDFASTLGSMQESQALGPFPIAGKYRAFQLITKHSTVTPFEALDAETRARMEQAALEVARERRLEEYLRELRERFRVELHPERLHRLPWPVPAPAPATGG